MRKTAFVLFFCLSAVAWASEEAGHAGSMNSKITCALDQFGKYSECSQRPLGQICPIQQGKQIVWGRCKAADSDDQGDIYCLCK